MQKLHRQLCTSTATTPSQPDRQTDSSNTIKKQIKKRGYSRLDSQSTDAFEKKQFKSFALLEKRGIDKLAPWRLAREKKM